MRFHEERTNVNFFLLGCNSV